MKTKALIALIALIICIPACRNYWHTEAEYRAQLLSSSPDQPRPTEPPDPAKKPELEESPDDHQHDLERPSCPGSIEVTKVHDPDSGDPYVFLKEKDFDRIVKHMHDLHVYALQLEELLGVEPPESDPEPEPDEGPAPPKPAPKGKVY